MGQLRLYIDRANTLWVPAGACQYEIHDDHIEWDAIKVQWTELEEQEKLRYEFGMDAATLLQDLQWMCCSLQFQGRSLRNSDCYSPCGRLSCQGVL